MSKFHSTVTRRDFMKGLGLGAAGLGAAAAAAPVFHDLDELAASPNGVAPKHPWWTKQRDFMNPTTEIHWDQMERFQAHTISGNFFPIAHTNMEDIQKMDQEGADLNKRGWLEGLPGRDARAQTMVSIGWLQPYSKYAGMEGMFLGEKVSTPADKGLPKWEGTPEENAATIRAFAMSYGAAKVSFGVIEENTTKKLINATSMDWGENYPIVFEDVDEPYVEDNGSSGKVVIANKMKYVIILMIRQQLSFNRTSPSAIAASYSSKAYDQIVIMGYRIKAFLRGIGYHGVSGETFGITCARPGWGTLFGLGEFSRMHEMMTPEYGPLIRTTMIIPTDMPLPPQNPVDFGSNKFCSICVKCADACPVSAIYDKEADFIRTPSDSTAGPIPADHLQPHLFNNSPGYKRWPLNHYACGQFWSTNGNDCSICQGVCVFNKMPQSSIHEFVKPIIASTSILNGFFYNMDLAYGYGLLPEEKWDDFWTDVPDVDWYDMHY